MTSLQRRRASSPEAMRGEVRWLRRGELCGYAGEVPRDLCYRLYMLCEKRKRVPEAVCYHARVQSWSEVARLAREGRMRRAEQTTLFEGR